jgi:hygromycin-B 4-O-kinase
VSEREQIDGLKAVAAEALDIDQVRAFLDARYEGHAEGVEQAGRGEWSIAYGFRLDQTDYVIRFGNEREDFEKDRRASAYASAALPIPRVVEIGDAFGGSYAISTRAFGEHLDALGEAAMRAALPSLLAALDAARFVDLSGTSGFGGWGGSGDAPYFSWAEALLAANQDRPRVGGWRERMAASRLGCAAFDEAYACLTELVAACPNERHLIHGDLLNRNTFVQADRISALIDWGCAMYGDFVYEVAHLTFAPLWFPAWREIDFAGESRRHYEAIGLDVPRFDERLRCYEIHIGLEACAYNAFRGRWDEVEALMRRTLQVARALG